MDSELEHRSSGGMLQLSQDIASQRRDWVFQRVGWVVFGMIVLGALLGLFGPGPLSRAVAGLEAGELWVDYRRFWRLQVSMSLRVHVGAEAVTAQYVKIRVSRPYLESVSVESVVPQPRRVEAGSEYLTYTFDVSVPGQAAAMTFTIEPTVPGLLRGAVALEGGPDVEFTHFIYP